MSPRLPEILPHQVLQELAWSPDSPSLPVSVANAHGPGVSWAPARCSSGVCLVWSFKAFLF